MHHILPLSAALAAALLLGGCQPSEPEPTCRQSVRVSERHGQQVIQAVNGLYLRADFPISDCEARPYSKDPKARHFVRSGSLDYYWWKGALYDGREHAQLVRAGALTAQESILIHVGIGFHENEDDPARAFLKPRAWWYQPAIPHQHYPIDLLPNFGLDAPDPQAGVGPVKTAYWAVRGSQDQRTGFPYVNNYCSMMPPAGWDGKDYSWDHDVHYLVQAHTNSSRVGNICRGGVTADNGKPIGARLDIPGRGLPDIDKIYQAISQRLSQYTVE